MRADAAAFEDCAERLQDQGVDLAGYTLPQRVDDLDAARKALGYEHVDLLSESAGTRTAMIYAWRYPKRIHRSVMVGANPPGHFLWDAQTTGEQIGRYAALCAEDASCRSRTPDLPASILKDWRITAEGGGLPDPSTSALPAQLKALLGKWDFTDVRFPVRLPDGQEASFMLRGTLDVQLDGVTLSLAGPGGVPSLVRVLGDLIRQKKLVDHWRAGEGPKCFESFLGAWREEVPKFRSEGFYERFPAKGQVERVRRIHQDLLRPLGLEAPEEPEEE